MVWNINTSAFKRISDKRIAFTHLIIDLLALVTCHWLFINKYGLPYNSFFHQKMLLASSIPNLYVAVLIIISFWIFSFYISGHYSLTGRKSGLQVLGPTLVTSFIVSTLLFLIISNNTSLKINVNFLGLFMRYLILNFVFIYYCRMMLIYRLQYLMKKGKRGYKQLLVGNNDHIKDVLEKAKLEKIKLENRYIGYLSDNHGNTYDLSELIPCLGTIDDIGPAIKKGDADEATICLPHVKHSKLNYIISNLRHKNILIRLFVENDFLIDGAIKHQSLESFPYLTIGTYIVPVWQQLFKRTFDICAAVAGLIFSIPIIIPAALFIKYGSKGPIIYKQERIGKNKRPFYIYKFRTMYADSEKDGPALSSSNDERITPTGRFMRKWRLDEIPQFVNILLGDMSLVGPRPERQHFINQILPKAPHYAHVFSIRPGITSWGMVKYGYAENIDQMIERLQYDLQYLENRTLVIDFKILLYTIKTLFSGEGK